MHAPGALLSSCPYFKHNQFLRFQYTGQENVGDLRAEKGVNSRKGELKQNYRTGGYVLTEQ